jgi:FkbM family methyltransferase
MLKKILQITGLHVHSKYLRHKYFPSKTQRHDQKMRPRRLSFYEGFVKPGDLCFDVGANIGNRTEIFLLLGARVVAIEPQRDCAKMLKLRFGNKIQLKQMALGESETTAQMYISDTSEISSLSREWIDSVSKSRFSNTQWNKTETVEVTTLDALIASHGLPKFCKIDVEGHEEPVLKGLSRRIEFISFEYTIPERLINFYNCLSLLSAIADFKCNYTIGEKMEFELPVWVSKEELKERVRAISGKHIYGDVYIQFNT